MARWPAADRRRCCVHLQYDQGLRRIRPDQSLYEPAREGRGTRRNDGRDRFEQPVANTDERFSGVPILPKHIWEKFKDEKSATEFENLEMIGSGPFKMAEFKSGEFTRLTAVKDHYLSPPKIDEVIFRVY